MSESEKEVSGQAVDDNPALEWIWRNLPQIGLVVGVVLCLPDAVRELGFMGAVIALSSAIILAARIVAGAIERREK